MSKLEYKIENITETEDGYVVIPKKVWEMCKQLNGPQYYSSSHSTTNPSEIYCKDCKHCIITEEDADSNDPLFPVTRTLEFVECPISTWFEQVWCIIESGFYENGGYICDLDTLRPPPNCSCFEPKEAK